MLALESALEASALRERFVSAYENQGVGHDGSSGAGSANHRILVLMLSEPMPRSRCVTVCSVLIEEEDSTGERLVPPCSRSRRLHPFETPVTDPGKLDPGGRASPGGNGSCQPPPSGLKVCGNRPVSPA